MPARSWMISALLMRSGSCPRTAPRHCLLSMPVQSKALNGLDSLLSIVQMPAGVPVATVAIGRAGATNAGLLAVSILALSDEELASKLQRFREDQTAKVLAG